MIDTIFVNGIAIVYTLGSVAIVCWTIYRFGDYFGNHLLAGKPEPHDLFSQLRISPFFRKGKINIDRVHPLQAWVDLAVYQLLVFAIACTWIISIPAIVAHIIITRKQNGKLSESDSGNTR